MTRKGLGVLQRPGVLQKATASKGDPDPVVGKTAKTARGTKLASLSARSKDFGRWPVARALRSLRTKVLIVTMPGQIIHRDVKASGVRLRVAESGRGPTMLLLHSVLMDHTSWDYLVPHLTEGYRVVAPDLPGFGKSEKPTQNRFNYSVDAFAHALADLYAALDLGRAVVVGHGLGGALGLALAADHAELVSKLVLIDPLCYEPGRDWFHRLAVTPLVGGVFLKQLWGRAGFRRYFREALLGPDAKVPTERLDGYYATFNSPASRGSALSTLRATRDTRSIVACTGRVRCPTLVIWGRHDRLYLPAQGPRLVRDIPGAGFKLLDAGHLPQEEQPTRVADCIRQFAPGLTPTPPPAEVS